MVKQSLFAFPALLVLFGVAEAIRETCKKTTGNAKYANRYCDESGSKLSGCSCQEQCQIWGDPHVEPFFSACSVKTLGKKGDASTNYTLYAVPGQVEIIGRVDSLFVREVLYRDMTTENGEESEMMSLLDSTDCSSTNLKKIVNFQMTSVNGNPVTLKLVSKCAKKFDSCRLETSEADCKRSTTCEWHSYSESDSTGTVGKCEQSQSYSCGSKNQDQCRRTHFCRWHDTGNVCVPNFHINSTITVTHECAESAVSADETCSKITSQDDGCSSSDGCYWDQNEALCKGLECKALSDRESCLTNSSCYFSSHLDILSGEQAGVCQENCAKIAQNENTCGQYDHCSWDGNLGRCQPACRFFGSHPMCIRENGRCKWENNECAEYECSGRGKDECSAPYCRYDSDSGICSDRLCSEITNEGNCKLNRGCAWKSKQCVADTNEQYFEDLNRESDEDEDELLSGVDKVDTELVEECENQKNKNACISIQSSSVAGRGCKWDGSTPEGKCISRQYLQVLKQIEELKLNLVPESTVYFPDAYGACSNPCNEVASLAKGAIATREMTQKNCKVNGVRFWEQPWEGTSGTCRRRPGQINGVAQQCGLECASFGDPYIVDLFKDMPGDGQPCNKDTCFRLNFNKKEGIELLREKTLYYVEGKYSAVIDVDDCDYINKFEATFVDPNNPGTFLKQTFLAEEYCTSNVGVLDLEREDDRVVIQSPDHTDNPFDEYDLEGMTDLQIKNLAVNQIVFDEALDGYNLGTIGHSVSFPAGGVQAVLKCHHSAPNKFRESKPYFNVCIFRQGITKDNIEQVFTTSSDLEILRIAEAEAASNGACALGECTDPTFDESRNTFTRSCDNRNIVPESFASLSEGRSELKPSLFTRPGR